MEVSDVTGHTLFQLDFCLTEVAVVKNLPLASGSGQRLHPARPHASELAT